ncbi:hypothetical protein [Rickettsiella endosymbiont of Rhagonycha lignosa]|uniref:hypothetical protein n=1 Tax=Rickettsiella endosymbiont of Rhagonycha lignosa TaxID=3077937 RepID=UPI00313AB6E5
MILHVGLKKGREEGILLIARNLLQHCAILSLVKSVTGSSELELNLEKQIEEKLCTITIDLNS